MPIVRGTLRNTNQFRQLLADTLVPSIFSSVELGPNNQIMCLDADRNIMMEFSDRPNGSSTSGYYRVYRSQNDFVTLAEVNQVINNADGNVTNYIGCENGIIVQGIATTANGYAYFMHFMITKIILHLIQQHLLFEKLVRKQFYRRLLRMHILAPRALHPKRSWSFVIQHMH